MYVGENESAKFWLSIMNGLKNRGVEDILIACVDGLSGFPQAIGGCVPENRNPAVHHPPDPELYKVCFLQRHQKTDGGPEACICCPDRRSRLK